jgi:hypothetical protein
MLLTYYYGIAGAGALLTGAWLFRPEQRTAITTLGAFLAWGLTALLGGSTETYTDAGATVQNTTINNTTTTVAVAQGETLTAAPVPDEIRLFFVMWALLSALALFLYVWGVYPPASDTPIEPSEVDEA